MDKTTQLWIRACKTENSTKRCQSILRRFYFGGELSEADINTGIIIHLTAIVDEYCPMKTIDVLQALEEPDEFYKELLKDDRDYRTRAKDMLISRIRQTKKSKFEGLTSPCWFKNKYKENK